MAESLVCFVRILDFGSGQAYKISIREDCPVFGVDVKKAANQVRVNAIAAEVQVDEQRSELAYAPIHVDAPPNEKIKGEFLLDNGSPVSAVSSLFVRILGQMNVPLQMVPTNTMVENVSGEGGVHVAIAWRFRIVAASVGIEATFLEIPNLKQDGLIGMNIFKMGLVIDPLTQRFFFYMRLSENNPHLNEYIPQDQRSQVCRASPTTYRVNTTSIKTGEKDIVAIPLFKSDGTHLRAQKFEPCHLSAKIERVTKMDVLIPKVNSDCRCGSCSGKCAIGMPPLFPNEHKDLYQKSNMSHGAPEVPAHFIAMGRAAALLQEIGSASRRCDWGKASQLAQDLHQVILDQTLGDEEGAAGFPSAPPAYPGAVGFAPPFASSFNQVADEQQILLEQANEVKTNKVQVKDTSDRLVQIEQELSELVLERKTKKDQIKNLTFEKEKLKKLLKIQNEIDKKRRK